MDWALLNQTQVVWEKNTIHISFSRISEMLNVKIHFPLKKLILTDCFVPWSSNWTTNEGLVLVSNICWCSSNTPHRKEARRKVYKNKEYSLSYISAEKGGEGAGPLSSQFSTESRRVGESTESGRWRLYRVGGSTVLGDCSPLSTEPWEGTAPSALPEPGAGVPSTHVVRWAVSLNSHSKEAWSVGTRHRLPLKIL